MKNILKNLLCATALALFCASTSVAAVGIGPYVDLSSGGGELEWDYDGYDWDVNVGAAAAGFALDTAPLGPSIFNYRLNVGLEGQTLEEDDYEDNALEMGGITVENVFGFAVVRKPTLRWWIGPLVRFGFYSGETDIYYDSRIGDHVKTEADLFEFGVGAATGVNIPLGKSRQIILAPSAGIRFIGVSGEGEYTNYDAGYSYEDDISGGYTSAFVNCAVLF